MCEANLCEDIAINTVATTLALAQQHHCFQLKAVCFKFIAKPKNLRCKFSISRLQFIFPVCLKFILFHLLHNIEDLLCSFQMEDQEQNDYLLFKKEQVNQLKEKGIKVTSIDDHKVEMSIAWNALSEEEQSYVKQTNRLEMQVRKSKCR